MNRVIYAALLCFTAAPLFAIDTGSVLERGNLTLINKTEGGTASFMTLEDSAAADKEKYARQYSFSFSENLTDADIKKELGGKNPAEHFVVNTKLNTTYNVVVLTIITPNEKRRYFYGNTKIDGKGAQKPETPAPEAPPVLSETEQDKKVFQDVLELNKDEGPLEVISDKTNENGDRAVTYKVSDTITRAIITTADGRQTLTELITESESLNDAVAKYTKIFTEQVPWFHGGFTATLKVNALAWFFRKYPKPYRGFLTIQGSRMYVEEFNYKERLIKDRRWFYKDYFNKVEQRLGKGFGFVTWFDKEKGVFVEDERDDGTSKTYEFDH